jgi:hypothetical protein
MALIKASYPKTWSKRHRVTFMAPHIIKAVIFEDPATQLSDGTRVLFWMKDHDFFYDEYPTAHYNTLTGVVCLREIPAKVVFHEVGNGANDSILVRAVLEAQEIEPLGTTGSPDYHTDLYTYNAVTFQEPKLNVQLRTQGYANHIDRGTTIDLVALNMAAWGDANIYAGIRETPGEVATGQAFDETGTARESIRLNAPFSKFRTARMTFETAGYTYIIRSIALVWTDYGRKQYG